MRTGFALLSLAFLARFARAYPQPAGIGGLESILSSLEKNSPDDAKAARGGLGKQKEVQENGDIFSILMDLKKNSPEDAAAVQAGLEKSNNPKPQAEARPKPKPQVQAQPKPKPQSQQQSQKQQQAKGDSDIKSILAALQDNSPDDAEAARTILKDKAD